MNSLETPVADTVSSDKTTGWQVSEHSQTKVFTVDFHEYPSTKVAMKAINGLDMIFHDEDGTIFQVKYKADRKKTNTVVITWRHQKSRQNGQQINLLVDKDHPEVYPALVVVSMVLT